MIGWDHPATAAAYERFCRRHRRYQYANTVLVREAALLPGLRVLDFGAGSGRTSSAALPQLGCGSDVVCFEPAAAMRATGSRRLRDRRVTWLADLPTGSDGRYAFDRVLAGAVVWQLDALDAWISRLTRLLRPGGALVFNVPALYLGEPDDAGGGRDPQLLDLMTRLASDRERHRQVSEPLAAAAWHYGREEVESALRHAGLNYRTWEFRYRFTQTAYARWLSIPVVTDGLLGELDAAERDRRIERALASVDVHSFKWERWRGWTAWKS